MKKVKTRPLRLTPYAWAKLLYLRDLGPSEVGGFGISAQFDLLLIEDICLIKQCCTEVTVNFDDSAVADYFDAQVDAGIPPERFGRIWIHTHPGSSPLPSNTDEMTFARSFGGPDWSLMFIVARGGQTYARLQFRAGPGSQIELPVEVDFQQPFSAAAHDVWQQEYERAVIVECPVPLWKSRLHRSLLDRDEFLPEHSLIESTPAWGASSFHDVPEFIDATSELPF